MWLWLSSLSFIFSIFFSFLNRRKESQTRRQTQEEAADAFIQTNFQPSEDVEQQQQQPDDNQNKAADRYIRVGRVTYYYFIELL